jgi:hypothetical protein
MDSVSEQVQQSFSASDDPAFFAAWQGDQQESGDPVTL